MSRIDEALRRAAQEGVAATESATSDLGVPPSDISELAREAYPLEMPKRRPTPRDSAVPQTGTPRANPVAFTRKNPREAAIGPDAPDRDGRLLQITHRALAEKLVIDTRISPTSLEQYRRLAATLHHAQSAQGLKVVMIASAVQGEGKTLTAANLALTFAESYQRRVLLIDADLRRPSQHVVFGVDNSAGLSDLTAKNQHRLSVRELSPRLALLPAGPPTPDPMAGLTSERMQRLIDEAREAFDWVIVDTPPVVMLPDANLLSRMVDGAVLVLRASSTPCDLVNRAVVSLGRDRILGVVLNGAESSPHDTDYGYHYYAEPIKPTAAAETS